MTHIQDLRLILRMRDERIKRERMELAIAAVCVLAAVLVSL
jgi:hypothetical protein